MRYYFFFIGGLLLTVLLSCNNNSTREQQYVPLSDVIRQLPPSKVINTSPLFNKASDASSNKSDSLPGPQAPANIYSTAQGAGRVALNPPHGQAGHRCDIPVGAPLNTAPTTSSAPTSSAPGSVNGQYVNPGKAIAAGLNPPHGQPGHRCDIAVGAPLNSKPLPVAQTNATTVVTPKGMNPPHGQPGHRCDIAIGAPLNSKSLVTPTVAKNKTEPIPPAINCVTGTELPADGLNPEHGKPGHRCDMNVGASLSSKPAPSVADKLNPPHGQNGHRCDIAVGAFIDSPRASATKDSTNS
jgi:hypothetical protein